ncbi:MAG: sugar-binding domain-containing protein, partial [Planctomycetota bacterium]
GKPQVRSKPIEWEYGRDASYLQPARPLDRSPNLAIRDGNWKLLVNDDGSRLELYDFSSSHKEFENVVGEHPDIAEKLSAELLAWRKSLPVLFVTKQAQADPPPAKPAGHLVTRWAADVDPANVLPEYPRPQMVRDKWLNLNGHWQYAIRPKDQPQPETFDGRILVPYPIESILSGLQKRVDENSRLWYRRTFTIPKDWTEPRTLLHFGAVDWKASVWVNGKHVGDHQGGYDPFSFDITDASNGGAEQELVVGVWDPTDTGSQPRGKQVKDPRGIWYTPVTGIWQTVWLEPVPEFYIRGMKIVPRVDSSEIHLILDVNKRPPRTLTTCRVRAEGKTVAELISPEDGCLIEIPDVRLWSPDDPFLYEFTVDLFQGDRVKGYFGMRSIAMGKGPNGFNRLLLNNKPVFQYGPLDQGWWPDGLYTAPTDEALRFDIEMTKKLGFNMARKHVKVEPERWYYWCDRLGLLVWQDMPSGFREGSDQAIGPNQPNDATFAPEEKAVFRHELKAMIDALHNSPSIVVWVPFNEGWGQHDTNEILQWTKKYDKTRLVDGPSGWEDRGWGDMKDMHRYPGPGMFPTEEKRASVLGEFGGLGLPLAGHTWVGSNNWGYRNYATLEELNESYANLLNQTPALIADGLAAAIYTQTTDVEIEVNGLMTYDRAIVKFDIDRLQKLHARLYEPPGRRRTIVPTSETEP